MKIHTDILIVGDLHRLLPADCYLECTSHGSRSRDHAFKVGIDAEPGSDAHGIKRVYSRNTGHAGAGYDRAATWIEWGDWMVELFKLDPNAIIGTYNGAADFVEKTTRYAPSRQKRENAVKHAARWARELEDDPDTARPGAW